MTPVLTGPGPRTPWQGAVVALIIAAIIIIFGLILMGLVGEFLVDWLWFSEIGYVQVFWTTIAAKAALFVAVFVVTIAILWANGALARRLARPSGPPRHVGFEWNRTGFVTLPDYLVIVRHRLPWPLVVIGGAGVLALFVAWAMAGSWGVFLRYFYQVPYGASEPLFSQDIGFYLFSLPAYLAVKNWMLGTLFLSALLAGAIYFVHGDIAYGTRRRPMSPTAIAHGSVLLAAYFAVKAWSYALDRYLLLYGDNGVVIGASYTDIHVALPLLWLLIGLSIVAAVVCAANLRPRGLKLPIVAVGLVFGGSSVLSGLIPTVFQNMFVKPSELEREKPYIERNIALTRQAYNLDQIASKPFPAEQVLNLRALEANKATIDNIRLWDWQPLTDTYAQLQEIRTYYKFHNIDIDRYRIDGRYQSVMLAAREFKSTLLPGNAQTFVNRHVLFTHGNGAVMSPVTLKSNEGLPLFYLRDIPPVAAGGPTISEPRIYYGEETDTYVIVKGTTPEFDYPKGKDNIYAAYNGTGGVPIGSLARKTLFGWYFGDVNLLLSTYVAPDSRIMFRRNIQERVRTIAPFLRLDRDPYLVISGGRLFFIQDAYTTSRYFPYAQPAQRFGLNYIRNSVKIVIDAYNGSVDFYLMESAEPIAATWQHIFPELFKPFAAMPKDLQAHIRYPEDLFVIQAQIYQAYHMERAEVFYNREDLWQFPRHPEGGGSSLMTPYYIIMRLPGEAEAEFFLMIPMVPSRRDNMIAWLAARCDAPDYGKLIVYEFPKDKLVYGPFQIEARINQNTEISQQLSLWNQLGSRVIRGNLLVIPIESSLLYVSPLYLRAERGQLPELKRVIAAYGEHVVMKETLTEALAALFSEPGAEQAAPGGKNGPPFAGAAADRAHLALERYNAAIDRLRAGDWAGFGAELDALRRVLEEMGREGH
jgi:uncharacterized membrane protein (UPF0182 family)